MKILPKMALESDAPIVAPGAPEHLTRLRSRMPAGEPEASFRARGSATRLSVMNNDKLNTYGDKL